MIQMYKKDEIVYTYFFDSQDNKLKYEECIVYNYMYLDGMLWNIIDEYVCYKEYYINHFIFFKKKKQSLIRIPGLLLSNDKMIAKMKLFIYIMHNFNYVFDDNKSSFINKDLVDIVKLSKLELDKLIMEYPEKYLKALDVIIPTDQNFSIWR